MYQGFHNPYFFVGVIENNVDERLEGRVQVRAFGIHGTIQEVPTEDLPWAVLIHGSYDPNSPVPPLNSWVFGFFLDGRDAQQPMILGLIPTQMTEPIDPIRNGWGVIPERDGDVLATGSRPEDFGQPANSRLARGEYIEETYVPAIEANRVSDIDVPNVPGVESWSEPGSAYDAQYPYNRVIQTAAGHSIELDDTPGSERIMIHHKSGSYIQVDSRGTTTHKSTSDKYEVNQTNCHVYVGGRSLVTIEGDSHVLVKGNKTEEVIGDYVQMVHGNHLLSVGGQINFNGSEEVQMRAGQLRLESNVAGINIKAAKGLYAQSGESMHFKSGIGIFQDATNSLNIKAGDNIFTEAGAALHSKSETMYIDATGALDIKGGHVKIGGGSKVSINASVVAIDDIVQLANNQSTPPNSASEATPSEPTPATELPEPVAKNVSAQDYKNISSTGTNGYASTDENDVNSSSTNNSASNVTAVTKGVLNPLLDFIGNLESSGYDTIFSGISRSDYPVKQITSMTIQEILNWQSSIDAKYNSEAVGRYQFLEDTLRGIYRSAGLTENDVFSPENQDKLAIYQLRFRGLDRYLNDSISAENFCNNLAKEWASLPVVSGPGAGKSYYAGDKVGNKSLTSANAFLEIVKNVKTNNDLKNEKTPDISVTSTEKIGPSLEVNTKPESTNTTNSATSPANEKVLSVIRDPNTGEVTEKLIEITGVDERGFFFRTTKRVKV